jgi:hypothetical protein
MSVDPQLPPRAKRGSWIRARLVSMYPREWRHRYQEELLDLLAARPMTLTTVVDTVRGAIDAHTNVDRLLAGPRGAQRRIRSASTTAITAWVLLGFAAAGAAKSTEGPAFAAAARSHQLVGVARLLAVVGFGIATAVLAAGGAGVVVVAVRQFWAARDRRGWALLMTPPAAVALTVAAAVAAGRLPGAPVHSVRTVALASALMLVAVSGAAVSVWAGAAVLARTELPARLVRMLGFVLPTAAGAMFLAFGLGCVYGLALWVQAPGLVESDNGILETYLPLTWVLLLVIAALAVAMSTRLVVRGLRSLRST